MTRKEENEKIIEAIEFFDKGKFNERKPYIHDLLKGKSVSYNGFRFQKDTWCWIILKPTDIEKEPGYKGEPLCKAIPAWSGIRMNTEAILNAQPWVYL